MSKGTISVAQMMPSFNGRRIFRASQTPAFQIPSFSSFVFDVFPMVGPA